MLICTTMTLYYCITIWADYIDHVPHEYEIPNCPPRVSNAPLKIDLILFSHTVDML